MVCQVFSCVPDTLFLVSEVCALLRTHFKIMQLTTNDQTNVYASTEISVSAAPL